ncbi:hypothetical protein [Yinghuangia seranimata]|uniref:hypothetical protein n=1 Tax=Yinghuangia seranimata TaxID=408067 RepID=UPI00248BE679|nr:hypothetical protein [Yinghuangia seranimata]MDI2129095.1 hypothetical protein [Yinghuangia seranimata]
MTLFFRSRTFELAPKPWATMSWVEIPAGLTFVLYEPTTVTAFGSPVSAESAAQATRWANAYEAFDAELRDAQSEVRYAHGIRTKPGFMADNRTVRLRRYDLVPGRRTRSVEAWEHCAARMRAADAAYQPVRDEIEARRAAGSPS